MKSCDVILALMLLASGATACACDEKSPEKGAKESVVFLEEPNHMYTMEHEEDVLSVGFCTSSPFESSSYPTRVVTTMGPLFNVWNCRKRANRDVVNFYCEEARNVPFSQDGTDYSKKAGEISFSPDGKNFFIDKRAWSLRNGKPAQETLYSRAPEKKGAYEPQIRGLSVLVVHSKTGERKLEVPHRKLFGRLYKERAEELAKIAIESGEEVPVEQPVLKLTAAQLSFDGTKLLVAGGPFVVMHRLGETR